ncbi:MAG TPA: hypothetical protein DEP85_08020 [Holosporales bacterium]|nr:hypothetical protein [Holosporales bacterium]
MFKKNNLLFLILGIASSLFLENEGRANGEDTIVIGGIGPEGECERPSYVRSGPNCITINTEPKTHPTIVGDAFDENTYHSLSRYVPDGSNHGEIHRILFERVGKGLVEDEKTKTAARFYLSMLSSGDPFTYISYSSCLWSYSDGALFQPDGLNRYFDFSFGLAEKIVGQAEYALQPDDYKFLTKPLNESRVTKMPSVTPKTTCDSSPEGIQAYQAALTKAYLKELKKARPREEPRLEDNASSLGLNRLFFIEELGLRDVRVTFRRYGETTGLLGLNPYNQSYSVEISGIKQ